MRKLLESEAGFSEPVWQELVALGWTGINLPESVGGSGLGIAALIPVVESMGKGLMGTPLVSTVLAAELIRRAGGIAEEDVLEDISGGCAATVAYLDGSDWGATNTGVSVDANGVLSGSKFMVPDAAQATWIHLVAPPLAGSHASRHASLAVLLVYTMQQERPLIALSTRRGPRRQTSRAAEELDEVEED